MVNINDVFPSKYLSSNDLNGKEPTVVIANAEVIEMENEGRKDRKLAISFEGKEKQLVLNKTNSRAIADLYGEDTDYWIGKAIKLVTARVDFQGRRVSAIRIDPPGQVTKAAGFQAQAPAPLPPPKGHPASFDDSEVPF